ALVAGALLCGRRRRRLNGAPQVRRRPCRLAGAVPSHWAILLVVLAACSFVTRARADYTFTRLEVPGAAWSSATGIDRAGDVVGSYSDPADVLAFRTGSC